MVGNEVYQALALGQSLPNDRLDAALVGLYVASDWVRSGDRLYMQASVELERYRRLPISDAARNSWLARSRRDLEWGLASNPADGRASLLLAIVCAWQGAPARDVVVALLHSMDTMPNLRLLWVTRMTVFFAAWSALTPDESAAVRSQLRSIWQNAPDMRIPLIRGALAAGRLSELSMSLADEPGALAELGRLKDTIASKP